MPRSGSISTRRVGKICSAWTAGMLSITRWALAPQPQSDQRSSTQGRTKGSAGWYDFQCSSTHVSPCSYITWAWQYEVQPPLSKRSSAMNVFYDKTGPLQQVWTRHYLSVLPTVDRLINPSECVFSDVYPKFSSTKYLCTADYYENWSTSDLVIARTKRVNFFWNAVYFSRYLTNMPNTVTPSWNGYPLIIKVLKTTLLMGGRVYLTDA